MSFNVTFAVPVQSNRAPASLLPPNMTSREPTTVRPGQLRGLGKVPATSTGDQTSVTVSNSIRSLKYPAKATRIFMIIQDFVFVGPPA